MKNKIGWCSMTFNPVWGCRNKCPYCYARAIAKRFWKQRYNDEFNFYYMAHPNWVWTGDYLSGLKNFKPTFLYSQYAKKFPQKPQKIFVGSMSEIYYWENEWIERVIEKVKQYPQHIFIFLTKHPGVYAPWVWPENCWLGVTMTSEVNLNAFDYSTNRDNIKYVSYEPLLNEIILTDYLEPRIMPVDWVIIGAETGNRKGKIIPKKVWIENIVNYCKWNNIPIYLKDSVLLGNIKNIYPEEIKMFPEAK